MERRTTTSLLTRRVVVDWGQVKSVVALRRGQVAAQFNQFGTVYANTSHKRIIFEELKKC